MCSSQLEDATPLQSALPLRTVLALSTAGSPAQRCYTTYKQKNKKQKNFHVIAPFLAIHVFERL